MSDFEFVRVKKKQRADQFVPNITFVKNGIRLGAIVAKNLAMEFCELFWDEKNLAVGFKFSDVKTEDSFTVRFYREKSLAQISCTNFYNQIKEHIKDKKSFELKEYKDLLIANLGGDSK